jgi:hypothetical protein
MWESARENILFLDVKLWELARESAAMMGISVTARIRRVIRCGSLRARPKSDKLWVSAREYILFSEVLSSRRYYCGMARRRFTGDDIRDIRANISFHHHFAIRHNFAAAPA